MAKARICSVMDLQFGTPRTGWNLACYHCSCCNHIAIKVQTNVPKNSDKKKMKEAESATN